MHRKSLVKIIGFGFAALTITLIPGRTYAEKDLPETIIQIESLEDGETKPAEEVEANQSEDGKVKLPENTEVKPPEDTAVKQLQDTGVKPLEDTGVKTPEDTGSNPSEDTEVKPPEDTGAKPPEDVGGQPAEGSGEEVPKDETPKEEPAPSEKPIVEEPAEKPTEEEPVEKPVEEEVSPEEKEKLEEKDKPEEEDKPEQESEESKEELVASRIHAGTTVYVEDLKKQYNLSFSEDIDDVMEEIEEEYIQEHKISGEDDQKLIRANNWQDILAVYLLRQQQAGETNFYISRDSKDGLKEVYKEMNRLVAVKHEDSIEKTNLLYTNLNDYPVQYENLYVEEVIRRDSALNKPVYGQHEQDFLGKYSSEECMILSAAATNAQGFITQSLSTVSDERKAVVESAYSLVGKIAYFWGGKSTAIGWDKRWGEMEKVSASGSQESGTIREYGLDCSGFVSWAFLNGAHNSDTDISAIGAGTGGQWHASTAVSEQDALPGDLAFLSPPGNAASAEHIGIVIGKTTKGDLIAVHCNATDNGVTVQSAYEAGFRYVRSPKVFSGSDQINHN